MRVFLTGATGFIGSHVIAELLAAGHDVLGMTRSDKGAEALKEAGVAVHHAALEDLESIRAGAAGADAVIHTAFDHDFSRFVENCEKDRRVIGALADVLKGSDRPLIITSGVGMGEQEGGPAVETVFNVKHRNPRIASEEAGNAAQEAGVDVRVVRLPQVHDTAKQGLISPYIAICREKGAVAYVGDGGNRYSAAHVGDVAKLYALALDKGRRGERYNAVAEEGVPMRRIAEVVGAGLGLPVKSVSAEEVQTHFGWFALFAGFDLPASSALTRQRLGWTPVGPGLIDDLERMDYSAGAAA
ncbi:SDR family oxidoreductase [Pleomorphomonas carboxyditropha]|uniref:NAD-dependent dehydratase n=1 Tax=Pleomorphomonas carboxyditropha TaxID=2023338 RepID=A0A2G9WP16_9HYPH|nr:SDR family oxidoreductase [Pleomorphomonas carboxyditropha]PIO96447.1 NAD-dependent dehydratase [Pleomorphomonas carboxyditropha]